MAPTYVFCALELLLEPLAKKAQELLRVLLHVQVDRVAAPVLEGLAEGLGRIVELPLAVLQVAEHVLQLHQHVLGRLGHCSVGCQQSHTKVSGAILSRRVRTSARAERTGDLGGEQAIAKRGCHVDLLEEGVHVADATGVAQAHKAREVLARRPFPGRQIEL